MSPVDDFARFRTPQAAPKLPSKPPGKPSQDSRRRSEWFLKGPIPGPWLQIASDLPGRALNVGLAIWYLSGVKKSPQVKITKRALNQMSIPPDAYLRGLKQLESAGLVRVERAPGRRAVVTLLEAPATDEADNQK